MAIAKREKAWKTKLLPGKQYPIDDALKMVKEFATAKFNDGGEWSDIGDATPQNVGKKVSAAFIRMASTRAMAAPHYPGRHSPQPKPLLLPGPQAKRPLVRRILG